MKKKIAVIGAGAVGLSTALNIQTSIENVEVTIIADQFDVNTTSDGAAGIFRPTIAKTPGVPLHILRAWLQTSWDHLDMLYRSVEGPEAGVTAITGYHLFNDKPDEVPLVAEFAYNFEECSNKECERISAQSFSYGFKYTTLLCESRRYLPYLMRKFKSNGGTVIVARRKIQSLSELVGRYDVVVNCTGYGSRELLDDNKITPMKGHLIRVNAPWIKHFLYEGNTNIHIIPGQDNVIVGGIKQLGVGDLEIKDTDTQHIWNSATKLVPSLKKAEWLRQWVGLRPFRNPLRLEIEEMKFPQGSLKVVHNYGHGEEGISLSWGTSVHAARLVRSLLPQGHIHRHTMSTKL